MIAFTVYGVAAAQGSKRHVGNGVMVESSKALKPWRQEVAGAAQAARRCSPLDGDSDEGPMFHEGPVGLAVAFYFARPKSHYRKDGTVKPDAPKLVAKKPDADKLLRAIGDALTGIVYRDDSQIADVRVMKFFTDEAPRAEIRVMRPGVF